ncbi:MAG: transcription-repair coupling factor [Fusobacteria bacterium]|nr:transcription-repair coupling factor [Fusobacteriota bacterium]
MEFKVTLDSLNNIYRGAIPFLLKDYPKKNIIYITSSNKNIDDYYDALEDLTSKKIVKIENYDFDEKIKIGEKLKLIHNLDLDVEKIIFINLEIALEDYNVKNNTLILKKNESIKPNFIIEKIVEMGYINSYLVEKKGEYSKRGDILDIYPLHYDNPIRIEFFDEIIENIRIFDIDTQRSIKFVDEILIPALEIDGDVMSLSNIIEKKHNDIEVFIENTDMLIYKLKEYIMINEINEDIYTDRYNELIKKYININLIRFTNKEIEEFMDFNKLVKKSFNNNIKIYTTNSEYYSKLENSNISYENKDFFEGFKYGKNIILTEREISGIKSRKRVNKRREAAKISDYTSIKIDDYVVHENFGVGIYKGIETIEEKDFLKIAYADEDLLYVPVNFVDRIEKYISDSGKIPSIYKLGRKGFKKKSEKLKKDIESFALELINIQAKRELKIGFKFSKDTLLQEEFEDNFPYNETKDQKQAVLDIKNDMESGKIMDRVVCGDVGYGKTEVAMRAAFKSVIDNKQVLILAPTTILVNQHFNRFIERFSKFPVNIEMISRMEKTKKQNEIIENVKNGKIDILIGTHRVLSDDIIFKDLGLLIIDEEQKFGVKAKESIKKYKNDINILTLTATPIPRTLNLSLLGIKDISIIETPPKNRIPIDTKIIKYDTKLIKDAILKEISRDGQVFYVYNSVQNMKYKIAELEKILPEHIKITYIHGQMESNIIKDKISKFESNEYNILLTTTIIENGIDIENVNTIIIENFQNLGISQIYQLRGRVGRGGKKAYCYLMHKAENIRTSKGKKKVEIFEEMNELGTGFQLSLEDMNIRGAGEILGEKQHGAIESFGYDLYIKMLKNEINRIKNKKDCEFEEPNLNLKLEFYIPDSYISGDEKLKIYKKLGTLNSEELLDDIKIELKDRFGLIPESMENLIFYYKIKILSQNAGIKEIIEKKEGYYLKFFKNNLDINAINMLLLKNEVNYISETESILVKKDKNILNIIKKLKREC